jgi:hypothetical protein
MRLRFILPELEAFTRLNPARRSADIDNDELSSPGSEQAADVIFGERSDPCRGLESIISPQFAEWQVRHGLERAVHIAATDLIVVQELNGGAVPAVGVTVRRERRWTPAGASSDTAPQSAPDSCSAGPAIKC